MYLSAMEPIQIVGLMVCKSYKKNVNKQLNKNVNKFVYFVGPDGCQQTLLHRAIDENNEEFANFLIRCGCDLDSPRKLSPDGRGGKFAKYKQTAVIDDKM